MLPKLAGVADRMTVIRSIVGQRDEHSSFPECDGIHDGGSPTIQDSPLWFNCRESSGANGFGDARLR